MTLGISHRQLDGMSGAGLLREDILLPIATNANYFSAATDGGAQAAIDISASVAGATLNRSAQGKRPVFYARMPLVTAVNGSGNLVSATVRLTCRRFGKVFFQDVTVLAASLAVSGTHVVDEITAMQLVAVSGNGAGDTIGVGVDTQWLGLRAPIKSKQSVRMVYKIANGTPDSAGPKMSSDLTAAQVLANRDSAINVKSLFSNTSIAVTDRYLVEYSADGFPDFYPVTGLRFVG